MRKKKKSVLRRTIDLTCSFATACTTQIKPLGALKTFLIEEGLMRSDQKISDLSKKQIIKIIEELKRATDNWNNHECPGYYD